MPPEPFDAGRDGVAAFLRDRFRTENLEHSLRDLHAFALRLAGLGLTACAPALADLLDDPDPAVRVQAAWWLRQVRHNAPAAVRPDQDGRAAATLVRAIRDDGEERLLPLVLLGAGGDGSFEAAPAPAAALPALAGLLADPDDRVRVTAAAALIGTDAEEGILAAVGVLADALAGDDPGLAQVAAAAFARVRARSDQAAHVLAGRLAGGHPTSRLPAVKALKAMGPAAAAAGPALVALLDDEAAEAGLRSAAAGALGTVVGLAAAGEPGRAAARREAARAALTRAAGSPAWQVVWGAVYGLAATGGVPAGVVSRLTDLLDAGDDDLRETAARGLAAASPPMPVAVPDLVARYRRERHPGVRDALLTAMAAGGPGAVPALVAVLRDREPDAAVPAAEALLRIGRAAVPEVAGAMLADADEGVRDLGVAVLQRLGPRAEAAVPVAVRLLADPDPGVREHAAMAVTFIGPAARDAAPALVRALSDPLRDVAHWAEKALAVIGPDAVPHLRAAAPTDATGRDRAARLLAHFAGPGPGGDGFEWVGDDDKLVLFAWVGQRVSAGPVSRRRIVRELQRLAADRRWADAPAGESSLRGTLDALRDALARGTGAAVQLTRSDGRTGLVLTPEGRAWLGRVTAYLRKKGRLVAPGREPVLPTPERPG